jgi:hypothetical protein
MKCVLVSFVILLCQTTVDAAAWSNPNVECTKVTQSTDVTFEACATTLFTTPSPAMQEDGKVIYLGGYRSDYRVTTGLKKGTDTSTLSESELKMAYKSGITIQVELDDDNLCTVTVNVKEKSSECKSCKHCGKQKFTVDCTNVANGRKTTCESALGSQTVGQSKVFFPLKKSALPTPKPPTPTVVKTPVAAPVKKSPTK